MTYISTTSIPSNRERKQKEIDFDDADGTAKDIWTPPAGKKIYLNDVLFSVMNKHATGYIIIAVQVYGGGEWHTLVTLAVTAQSASNFAYNFGERIHSGAGNGTDEIIRIVKQGTSTSWDVHGIVTGEEI